MSLPMVGDFASGRGQTGHVLEAELSDQERRVVGRLLAERKARLIEITGDTTQSDPARRAALIELLTIASVTRKLR
jgi:hypothetical protein